MSDEHKSIKFIALDGLRGFAALTVMIFHFQGPALTAGWAPFKSGWLAVDFFFILSGFVIAHAYERRFSAGMSMGQFVGARLVRLAPMYLFGTALTITYIAVLRWKHYYLHPDPAQTFYVDSVLGLLAIPQLNINITYYPLNFPAWSLIYEIIANVVYRLIFKKLSQRILIALVVVSYLATYIKFKTFGTDLGIGHFVPDLVRVSYGFFAGVLVYRIWSRSNLRPAVPAWLLFIPLFLFFIDDFYEHYATTLFPAIVYLGACARVKRLTSKIFIVLGELSFGIYMVHAAIIKVAVTLINRFPAASASNSGPCAILAAGFAAIVIAFVSYHIYDVPIRSRMTRLLRGPSFKSNVKEGLTRTRAEPLAGGHR